MKNSRLILFIIILSLLTGCIDDPVQQNTTTINGIVYSEYGYMPPVSNVNVSSGLTIYRTSYNGAFILDNVIKPYNLVLSNFTFYLGLTNINPKVITKYGFHYPEKCRVTVHFPQLLSYKTLFLLFISDDFHEQSKYYFDFSYGTEAHFDVEILSEKSLISGKLIYLECNGDYGWVYDYKKYCIKDLTLFTNRVNEITFSQIDEYIDPPEKYMYINSVNNYGLEHYITESNLYIGDSFNEFTIDYSFSNQSYFTVPELPNLNYSIKITDTYGSYWLGPLSTKWVFLQAGENAEIFHDACPELVSPAENSVNISDTTTFRISDNNISGVYLYSLMQGDTNGYSYFGDLYTDRKAIRLTDVAKKDIKFPKNTKLMWDVTKISGCNSIDEFVSNPFYFKNAISLSTSKRFTFTTAP